MYRAIAITFAVSGTLLASYGAGRYAQGWFIRDRARQQWDAMQAHAVVSSARAIASVEWPRGSPSLGAPVARLVIPRIGLDEVVLEGVGNDELNAAPGHLPGSALPGAAGNAIISAHRDRHFDRLGEITVGDTLETETRLGRQQWVVTGRHVVDRDVRVLFETSSATLTLTTCWPIRYVGPAPERLLLTAKPLVAHGPLASRVRAG